ncbi:CDP-alcohol phosphatidyltransferase-domain-containing protein [Tirmania nivea]|nr:CDP-alcohol phosphatidyltransferase-domain-containing protein [Tirmania nivea]
MRITLESTLGSKFALGLKWGIMSSFRPSLSTCTSVYILQRAFWGSSTRALEKQEGGKTDLPAPPRPKLPYTPHEQIYNLPNFLTFTRILATPALGYFILHDQTLPALALLVTAGITDVLDGWIARKWNLQTVVGSVVDPMADKLLVTVLTVSLAMKGLLPVWLAMIILGRDVGLAISAIWYRYISLPPPKTFMRYWNFSLPSAEVKPTTISKVNTLLQLGLITASTAAPILPISEVVMVAAQYTVAMTTVWSGLSYVFSKNAVKILKQPGKGQEKSDVKNGNDAKRDTKS